jgi:hypothetical protein
MIDRVVVAPDKLKGSLAAATSAFSRTLRASAEGLTGYDRPKLQR